MCMCGMLQLPQLPLKPAGEQLVDCMYCIHSMCVYVCTCVKFKVTGT